MAITRITAQWSGFRGAPGYSNFFFGGEPSAPADAESAAQAVSDMFALFDTWLPTPVSVSILPTADVLDESTGNITSQVDITPPDVIEGGSTGTYSAASGAVINWNTSAYVNGRRVRGRTFLVPLTTSAYDSSGDLTSAVLTGIRNGAGYLTSGASLMPFVVWSRPRAGAGGTAHPVVSATVPDKGAVLRSRRD